MEDETTEELLRIVEDAYDLYDKTSTVFSLTDFEEAIIELTKREGRQQIINLRNGGMSYQDYGMSELIRAVEALEEALTQEYEKQDMTRSDAQGAVEALIMRALQSREIYQTQQ